MGPWPRPRAIRSAGDLAAIPPARSRRSRVIRAHQPGSEPIDIAETIPNPVVVPKPTPTPTKPAAIERLHEEFKRRIKTQTVLPSADTAAMMFWALLASGQINVRNG